MWLYRSKFNVEAFKCHSPVFRFRFQHFQLVVQAMHCMDWWEIIRQWSQTSISRQLNTSNDNIYIFTSNGFEPISLSLSLTHTSSRLCSWIFIQFWLFSFSQLHSKCSSVVSTTFNGFNISIDTKRYLLIKVLQQKQSIWIGKKRHIDDLEKKRVCIVQVLSGTWNVWKRVLFLLFLSFQASNGFLL